jgi:hypothetical protein
VYLLIAQLVSISLYIIEFASALTLLILVVGWALRHVGDTLLSLALDVANIRAKFRSVKKSGEELIVPERGLSGR